MRFHRGLPGPLAPGLALATAAAGAQPPTGAPDAVPPAGRRALSATAAPLGRRLAGPVPVLGVAFTEWFRRDWALDVSVARVRGAAAAPNTAAPPALTAALLGVAWYPTALALGPRGGVRPYAGAAVGPFIAGFQGAAARNRFGPGRRGGAVDGAPGARLTLGADLVAASGLRLGAAGAYYAVPGFRRPGGASAPRTGGAALLVTAGAAWGPRGR